MLTREQVKLARQALNWSTDRLAEKAGVSAAAIRQYENGADAIGGTQMKMRRAFEDAGIEFIPKNWGGAGVRLRKQSND